MLAWAIYFSSDRKPPASSLTCGLRVPVIYAQRARPSRARSCSHGGAPAYGGTHVGLSIRACRKSLCCYGNSSEPITNSEQISGDPREPAGNACRPRRARGAARRVLHCVSARVAVFAWRIQMYSIARSIFLKLNIGLYRAPVVYAHHAKPSRARAPPPRARRRVFAGGSARGDPYSRVKTVAALPRADWAPQRSPIEFRVARVRAGGAGQPRLVRAFARRVLHGDDAAVAALAGGAEIRIAAPVFH